VKHLAVEGGEVVDGEPVEAGVAVRSAITDIKSTEAVGKRCRRFAVWSTGRRAGRYSCWAAMRTRQAPGSMWMG